MTDTTLVTGFARFASFSAALVVILVAVADFLQRNELACVLGGFSSVFPTSVLKPNKPTDYCSDTEVQVYSGVWKIGWAIPRPHGVSLWPDFEQF